MNALVALDKVSAVNIKRKKRKTNNEVGINSRGSLIIPKKLVDAMDLDKTALFTVVKDGTDLFLKAKKRPPKTILRKKSK
ncbi:hypothetical protein DSCW_53430 [Desulfosarcina widdelii]|uniref:SpoVT-AbrB domain-containing protein n=1 Tax=Desulfosarcina widdelii TaxID=947919 RepID=A0A5K7Z7X9_9BACT|nr:hypothetical protein [Desulfosarcina widdelii]BBO77926.1 hypothetical protein DSCW_53430 [Desulfosarcina widdelii]